MSDCGFVSPWAVLASESSMVKELLKSGLLSLEFKVGTSEEEDDDDEKAAEDKGVASVEPLSLMVLKVGSTLVSVNSSQLAAPLRHRQKNVLFSLE